MAKNSKHGLELRKTLADNTRRFRKHLGLSQEEFADLCALHRTYVGSIEREERNVTLSSLDALAKALQISVAKLLTENIDVNELSGRKN